MLNELFAQTSDGGAALRARSKSPLQNHSLRNAFLTNEDLARAWLVPQTAIRRVLSFQKGGAKDAAFYRLEGVSMMGGLLFPEFGRMARCAGLRSDVLGGPTW